MSKQKTLADVAEAAGVSKMTASRALRGDQNVSKSRRDRVHKAAAEIGYSGNSLAASLSGKRSDLIGVIVPSFANVVFAEALSGITEALTGQISQPVFGVTYYGAEREYEVVRNMLSWRPSGLILTGMEQTERTRDLLVRAEIPIVQMMDIDGDPIDACVGFSHEDAGYDMAQALWAKGRRKFGYVGRNLHKDHRGAKRKDGFYKALIEAGADFVAIADEDGPTSVSSGRRMTEALLSKNPDLDCIYYASDDMAHGGLCYCIEVGISVPDQITMVGFNGLDLIQGFPGKIATSVTDRHEIGKAAANLILDAIQNPSTQKRSKVLISPKIDLGAFAVR
jgi:LacI family gluconate utilization system Gnt-I transcriptional repressor